MKKNDLLLQLASVFREKIPYKRKLCKLKIYQYLKRKYVINHGSFSERIRYRYYDLWETPKGKKLRDSIVNPNDPIEKWKDIQYWQWRLDNKCNAKEFAKMHGCKVADLYWKGRNFETIDFNNLPKQFVLKPTIGEQGNYVFLFNNNINLMDGKSYVEEDIKYLNKLLQEDPQLEFIIEEFVKNENGAYTIPTDYKFFTFNGKIACILVMNRFSYIKAFSSFYDENWNLLSDDIYSDVPSTDFQQPPRCLKEIIGFAKALSKSYEIFCRIDFYATDKGAVFGEFTPTPTRGTHYSTYANKMFAYYWKLYCKGMI